jgi:hypothetical protein
MGWWPRLLIALVLVVGYAFCYLVVPKIEASWTSPGPGCDLRLMPSVKDMSGIPTAGDSLVIVAIVDHALHFRIFDGHGNMVVDTDETKLPQPAQRIEDLKYQLESLWPPQKPTGSERVQVNADVTSIVGYTWPELPRWVIVLSWCSYFFISYVPAILLVLAAWILLRRGSPVRILLRRWSTAMKLKRPLRFQFGLRTVLGMVAAFAAIIALLNAWLVAPYHAEQHAATAFTQLGGKIVMVDTAPPWLRSYVGKDILNMDVAAVVDLSHSRVTDSDLVYLLAFQHCGQFNLSDTQISNAGLSHLRKVAGGRWLDLSRTRVTDVSALFGGGWRTIPAGLKLSGNRIARVGVPPKYWIPLWELDLSDTDADDGTLVSLSDGLSNLNLCGTNVSDDGLLSLLPMENLSKLNLIDAKVTPTGVARLKALWRSRGPLTILTGTRKKAGGASKTVPPQGSSGSAAVSR